jgi:preprotein translocase subunit SecG
MTKVLIIIAVLMFVIALALGLISRALYSIDETLKRK